MQYCKQRTKLTSSSSEFSLVFLHRLTCSGWMYTAVRQELACIGSSWSDERFLFPGRVAYISSEQPILTHKHAIISEKTSFTILVESRLPGLGFKAFLQRRFLGVFLQSQ